MVHTFDTYEEGRIGWVRYEADFRLNEHLHLITEDLQHFFDNSTQPVICVTDARDLHVGFGELVGALGKVATGAGALARHPNLMELVVITQSDVIKLATNALQQGQYGGLVTVVFDDANAAYDYAVNRLQTVNA